MFLLITSLWSKVPVLFQKKKNIVPDSGTRASSSTSNVESLGAKNCVEGAKAMNPENEEIVYTNKSDADCKDVDDDDSCIDDDNDNDDDVTEEWERHESLHNDVTSQDRTKERLFEEDIELKWEKGGSGLVFYTDAAFWKQQEEADFDEETADDWDVDMEIYENPGRYRE